MTVVEIVFGVALLVMSVFLVVAVLLQSGKEQGLSGSIAGGAETFFSKQKGASKGNWLPLATMIVAIVFTLLAVALYLVV